MNTYETKNKTTYLSPEVIDYYGTYATLQPPEETIFRILDPTLSTARMLDVGVGGGRTTAFFAPKVKFYAAFDYSEGMIERCKAKFAGRFPDAEFFVGDAKDLSRFEDQSFDFVLFSFNGVDHMPISSRVSFLREARRLLAPGGQLCFSTHNISSLKNLTIASVVHFRFNMFAVWKKILRRMKIRRINAKQLAAAETSDFAFVTDGSHDFGLELCYVRTTYQIAMLRDSGFKTIRGYSFNTGKEYLSEKDFCAAEDPWLYYLCS